MAEFDYTVKDTLKTKLTTISLNESPKYKTSFSLENVQVNLLCGYNTRSKLRWIILTDRSGNVLLPQTFLSVNKRCELGFYANENNLHYFVYLKPKNSNSDYSDYDYLSWKYDFDLVFVGFSQELKDRLDSNRVAMQVGG